MGELRYDIEWLGGSSSSVPTTHLLSDLCGSVLELIERCHAYMWPEVRPSTAGAKSDKERTKPPAWARKFSDRYSGVRLGCGMH